MRRINHAFYDQTVCFPGRGSWLIGRKLSEKHRDGSNGLYDEVWYPSEAHAVYECRQVEGTHIGMPAILKIRLQIPERDRSLPITAEMKARYAQYHRSTTNEIDYLQRLTKAECPATPSLLAVKWDTQREFLRKCDPEWEDDGETSVRPWMPGGYIVFILMEKLPGRNLFDLAHWGLSLEERDGVRRAFRDAMVAVMECGVRPSDPKRDNVVWDEKTKRCFIIDFEDAQEYDLEDNGGVFWRDTIYGVWCLSEETLFWGVN